MALINSIPKRHEAGFVILNDLSKEQFSELKSILPKIKLTNSIENLADKFETNENFNADDLFQIFLSVGSLIPLVDSEEVIPEIVNDIASLREGNPDFSVSKAKEFKSRLSFLLNSKQIYYAAKSEDLLENYGNVYILSRILSDVRPVFKIDVDEQPEAGFVIHTLSIHYQSNEEPFHRDIAIQLTPDLLQELKDTLNRAEKKEKVLNQFLKNSKIDNLAQ